MTQKESYLHATAVSVNNVGVLIMGAPGAGKTELALRLIDQGATLVADDQVIVTNKQGKLMATCPKTIEGLMELKGIGIVKLPFHFQTVVGLVVELVCKEEAVPEPYFYEAEGVKVKCIRLHAFNAATPAKVRLAVALITGKTKAGYSITGEVA